MLVYDCCVVTTGGLVFCTLTGKDLVVAERILSHGYNPLMGLKDDPQKRSFVVFDVLLEAEIETAKK